MSDVLTQLRDACATIAQRARHVWVNREAAQRYAAGLPVAQPTPVSAAAGSGGTDVAADGALAGGREELAAYWLTLDAINFGSGWFPTLRKSPGTSGYHMIAGALERRVVALGPWTSVELGAMTPGEVARTLDQDPGHELMLLFARVLRDLGRHVGEEYAGRFEGVVDAAGGSALALVEMLARWDSFKDTSTYDGLAVPFLKRAQLAAADLARAGVADLRDLNRLTMFADNLVPHVLRLDGMLTFAPDLVERIEREELIAHGSGEEVEIRAGALHAVELIVAARPEANAAEVDLLLWQRGQQPRYKARPRHRSRCTAY